MDTGARDTGTGLELNLFELVEEPTASDTVLEIRGAMLDTTWDTMSLELNWLLELPKLEVVLKPELKGAEDRGGGVASTAGPLEDPLTAVDTVEEIRGEMLDTTWDTMLSALKPLLELPKVEEPALEEVNPESENVPELDEPNPEPENDPELDPKLPLEKPELLVLEVVTFTGLALIST
jgi:hypothetical protein